MTKGCALFCAAMMTESALFLSQIKRVSPQLQLSSSAHSKGAISYFCVFVILLVRTFHPFVRFDANRRRESPPFLKPGTAG
jgi:hypothetical protein